MSLINDALKRASEAHQKAEQAPPPELKFRGIDARVAGPKKGGWVWPSVITACVLVGAFVVWQMAQRPATPQVQEQKEKAGETSSVLSPDPLKVHAREQEALPGGPLASAKIPDPAQTEKVAVVAVSGTTIQETTKGERTNASGATETGSLKGSEPRLQGIIFNPASPSATISGKTVFVGEKVGEWKVVAIDKESATLVGGGETNVLRLGQ